MKKYLLDTDICIYYLKGNNDLINKVKKLDSENIYISEITVAELKFGAENSGNINEHRKTVEYFINSIQILPIYNSIDIYAKEKARLRKLGTPVDDFDLLIASSAVANNMVLVTNNEKHHSRVSKIKIENWISQK